MQVDILFVSTILLSLATFSASAIQISGRLLSEQGSAIKDATISVGEFTTRSDQLGNFILKLDKSDTYSISFDKAGYFKSIQSFSFYELTKNSSTNNIGDITLVAKAKNRVMLAFGGDVMMGRRYYKPYFGDEVLINDSSRLTDSQAIVEHIKPYMSLADFSVVNLETQIAEHTPNERAPKSVTFYSKPETLEALKWAGIDYVTLGNNHTYDYMDSGLNSTIQFLNEAKLPFSGAGVNQEQALKAYQTTLNNNALSLLGFVGWEGNFTPNQTAGKNKGGAAFGSEQNLIKTVNEQTASGFTPIVQYHGSQEYADGPTNVTEHRLKSALDAGAELAIAHHPHVAQGLELYQGKLLAYSMGNFIFDQFFSSTPHSFILYVWLDSGKFHRAEIVPIYLKGYQPTPATGMHRYTILKRLSVLSAQRETYIERSGGHGVITKSASVNKFGTSKAVQQSVVNAKEAIAA